MAGGMMRSIPVDGRRNTSVAALVNIQTASANKELQETTGRPPRAMARAAWGH